MKKIKQVIKDLDQYQPTDLVAAGLLTVLIPWIPIHYYLKWSASLG